jgi:hypothetical protein
LEILQNLVNVFKKCTLKILNIDKENTNFKQNVSFRDFVLLRFSFENGFFSNSSKINVAFAKKLLESKRVAHLHSTPHQRRQTNLKAGGPEAAAGRESK